MLSQSPQHLLDMKDVFLLTPAGNEDVVHIHKHEVQALENIIEESLEALPSVPETKWHAEE